MNNKIITWTLIIGVAISLILSIGNAVGGNNQPVSNFGAEGDTNFTNVVTSGYITATGALTASGSFTNDTNTLVTNATNNNVGVGTSSPSVSGELLVDGAGTTTLSITSSSATKGACLQMDDNFGSTTAVTIKNGAFFFAANTQCK